MTGEGLRGAANGNWRGGRTITPHGYVLLRMPDHPAADVRGYVYEHRVVMERKLGRPLLPGERPRHIDNDPGNNDPTNLRLVSPLDRKAMTTCVCGCGTEMTVLDKGGRRRRFVTGHNMPARQRRQAAPTRLDNDPRPRCETAAGLDPEWRAETLGDFNGRCAYGCGRIATQWDHIIAWSRGGSFRTAGNAVPACMPCNVAKSDAEDPWPWIERALRSEQSDAMERVITLAFAAGELEIAA